MFLLENREISHLPAWLEADDLGYAGYGNMAALV